MPRQEIIRAVQKKADTAKQKIDASIVSRVASLTLDEVAKELRCLLCRKNKR